MKSTQLATLLIDSPSVRHQQSPNPFGECPN
jgi:hypothetical protein